MAVEQLYARFDPRRLGADIDVGQAPLLRAYIAHGRAKDSLAADAAAASSGRRPLPPWK